MEIQIIWKPDGQRHEYTHIVWDYEVELIVNPGRVPTQQERDECPRVFTCFSCLTKRTASKLGGRYHEKWFCSFCIPYVDEWTAGALLWWEKRRRKHHGSGHKANTARPTIPDNSEPGHDRFRRLVAAVEAARKGGYDVGSSGVAEATQTPSGPDSREARLGR